MKGKKPASGRFFTSAKLLTGAFITLGLLSLGSPKKIFSQENCKPQPEYSTADSLGFSLQLEGGMLTVLRDGKFDAIDIRDSIYSYSGRTTASISEDLVQDVISEMPKLGRGGIYIFKDWAFAYFPDAPPAMQLRFISAPGGKEFFPVIMKFNDGTVLLLNPCGYATIRHNFRASKQFGNVPDLVGPKISYVDSLDAFEVRDESIGQGRKLVIVSGEQNVKSGKLQSGIYLKEMADQK